MEREVRDGRKRKRLYASLGVWVSLLPDFSAPQKEKSISNGVYTCLCRIHCCLAVLFVVVSNGMRLPKLLSAWTGLW